MAVRIEFTIEGWTHDSYTDVIELDDEELAGLEGPARDKVIDEAVGEAVANVVSWGWAELGQKEG